MSGRSLISSLQRNLLRNQIVISRGLNNFAASRTSRLVSLGDKRRASSATTQSAELLRNTKLVGVQFRPIHFSSIRFETIVINSPEFAESVKDGNITFLKQVGDAVKEDELIANIETDKTAIEVKAPKAGVIEALLVEEGAAVTARSPIVKLTLGAGGGAAAAPAASAPKPAAAAAAPKPAAAEAPKQQESHADQQKVPPLPKAPAASSPVSKIPITPLATGSFSSQAIDINKIGGTRAETRVKMSKMRQTVSKRLKESQNTCAMLTTFNEINMENLMSLRKLHGEQFNKKHNLKLGFMSAFVKSAAYALTDQPIVNAAIDNNEIVYRDYIDISVAVATPKGLVVPVLRNVERMNYADIEREIASLSDRARQNKLAIEDMQGGTFTISNGGVFGSLFGTPIINLPQSAILGMHAIVDRPIAVNGQVVIKPMMYVALTYDHRLIDGREAVTFLKKIKTTIEDPRTMLLDI